MPPSAQLVFTFPVRYRLILVKREPRFTRLALGRPELPGNTGWFKTPPRNTGRFKTSPSNAGQFKTSPEQCRLVQTVPGGKEGWFKALPPATQSRQEGREVVLRSERGGPRQQTPSERNHNHAQYLKKKTPNAVPTTAYNPPLRLPATLPRRRIHGPSQPRRARLHHERVLSPVPFPLRSTLVLVGNPWEWEVERRGKIYQGYTRGGLLDAAGDGEGNPTREGQHACVSEHAVLVDVVGLVVGSNGSIADDGQRARRPHLVVVVASRQAAPATTTKKYNEQNNRAHLTRFIPAQSEKTPSYVSLQI